MGFSPNESVISGTSLQHEKQPHKEICDTVQTSQMFPSLDTTSVMPKPSVPLLWYAFFSSWELNFVLLVRLIECLQWTLQAAMGSFIFSYCCLSLSVKSNDIKSLHVSGFCHFMSLNYTFIKSQHVWVCCPAKQRVKPNIMRWPIFFCFLAGGLRMIWLSLGRAVANEPAMRMQGGLLVCFLGQIALTSQQTTSHLILQFIKPLFWCF